MSIFGLTGNLGCGKSTVLKLLRKKGAHVFDADKRIHQYYRQTKGPVYKKIAKAFPESLYRGAISRKRLGGIVFSDKKKLRNLERIVHPVVIKDMIKWASQAKSKEKICVAEVPLLFEKKLKRYFNGVILVVVKRDVLIKRIIKKYKFSKKEVLNRLSLYVPIKKKAKYSDFIINNSSDLKKLKKEVDLLWKNLKQNQKAKRR
jgi:dephospho-CoA kinase